MFVDKLTQPFLMLPDGGDDLREFVERDVGLLLCYPRRFPVIVNEFGEVRDSLIPLLFRICLRPEGDEIERSGIGPSQFKCSGNECRIEPRFVHRRYMRGELDKLV